MTQKPAKAVFFWMCWAMASVFFFTTGCEQKKERVPFSKGHIPVTFLKMEKHRLAQKARLTGSVMPWKNEELRFEVPGRVIELKIVTPGKAVKGELKDESGKILNPGDIIAVLDKAPYELALQEAQAQLEMAQVKLTAAKQARLVMAEAIQATKARVDAAEMEINFVLPLNVKIAEEQYKLAKNEHDLTKEAHKGASATQSRLAHARANEMVAEAEEKKAQLQKAFKEKELLTYKAEVSKAEVELKLREAEIKIAEAQLHQAEAGVKRADQSLQKCELRAPFDGVIAKININPGTSVDSTVPIATLVMMDPVRVDISISFKKIKDLQYGNEVKVFPFQLTTPEKGIVYHIHTTADPSTRTFLAIVAVRNRLLDLDSVLDYKKLSNHPQVRDFSGLVHKNPDGTGPLYVDIRCIKEDEKGYYVWKVAKKPGQRIQLEADLKKIYVKPGKEYINVITWLFRELVEYKGLVEEDVLLINPGKTFTENQKIVQVREDWLFHPGELVKVEYDRELPEELYLPGEAVLQALEGKEEEKYYVFVIEDLKAGEKGFQVGSAKKRRIIKRAVQDIWEIIDGLGEGEMVVVRGAHMVNNRYETLPSPVPIIIKSDSEESLSNLVKGYTIISSSKPAGTTSQPKEGN